MPFKYSCFISYPHPNSEGQLIFWKDVIKQIKEALMREIGGCLNEEVYIDDRLNTGYHYNETLKNAICGSVGMVVIYSQIYETRSYCVREYIAMERLETIRKNMLGDKADSEKGMIYPIIVRGEKYIPPKIKDNIHYCDFSKNLFNIHNISKKREYLDKIKKIADDIYEHYITFENLNVDACNNCRSFKLPSEDEARQLWAKAKKPLFPGREV